MKAALGVRLVVDFFLPADFFFAPPLDAELFFADDFLAPDFEDDFFAELFFLAAIASPLVGSGGRFYADAGARLAWQSIAAVADCKRENPVLQRENRHAFPR